MAFTYEEVPFLRSETTQKPYLEKLGLDPRESARDQNWRQRLGTHASQYKVVLLVISNLVLLGYLVFQQLYPYDPSLALYCEWIDDEILLFSRVDRLTPMRHSTCQSLGLL